MPGESIGDLDVVDGQARYFFNIFIMDFPHKN